MVSIPVAIPVTKPVLSTVANFVLVLVHTPPTVPSVNVEVEPIQTELVPVIVPAPGKAYTLNALVTEAEQPVLFETV